MYTLNFFGKLRAVNRKAFLAKDDKNQVTIKGKALRKNDVCVSSKSWHENIFSIKNLFQEDRFRIKSCIEPFATDKSNSFKEKVLNAKHMDKFKIMASKSGRGQKNMNSDLILCSVISSKRGPHVTRTETVHREMFNRFIL